MSTHMQQRMNNKHSTVREYSLRSRSIELQTENFSQQEADKLPNTTLWWMTAIYWPDFPTFTYTLPFDALGEGIY